MMFLMFSIVYLLRFKFVSAQFLSRRGSFTPTVFEKNWIFFESFPDFGKMPEVGCFGELKHLPDFMMGVSLHYQNTDLLLNTCKSGNSLPDLGKDFFTPASLSES